MLKAAIIGLGNIAPLHIKAIMAMPDVLLVAGCDTNLQRRALLTPSISFFTDYKEMMALKPDVVHICLPHYLHYPVAKEIAREGSNIFAEKPLALNYNEGLEYAALEERYRVKICICLQNRFNESTLTLQNILKSGEAGAVKGVRGLVAWRRPKSYYEEKPWRASLEKSGGGCMICQAVHTMDLMCYFAGSDLKTVKGSTTNLLDYDIEVEDTACAHVSFENGVTGFFSASLANYKDESAQVIVDCDKAEFAIRDQGLYRKDDQGEKLLAYDGRSSLGKAVYGSSHEKLIEIFYNAVKNNKTDYIHPSCALQVTRFIDAVVESNKTGKTVQFN